MLKNLIPEDKVLELGAGIGFNSIAAAKITGGKIIAYESNPDLFPLIKENQQLNNISFEVRNKILVTKKNIASTLPFYISENSNMSSEKEYQKAGHKVTNVIQVQTEYIGDLFTTFSPTFLVMDIEGGEEDFFSQTDFLQNSSINKMLVETDPEITGDGASTAVGKNILDAGFNLITGDCQDSRLFFKRK